ncbi:MAG: type II secretion system protein [Phycisphaerales bacterium]
MKQTRTMKRTIAQTRGGFSLIELMLVLAIIGVLMAVAAVSVSGMGARAKIRATKASLQTIQTALNSYNLEYSSYPTTLLLLTSVKPPFIDDSKKLRDGWDMEFFYSPAGRGDRAFSLGSYGEDKTAGTEDDIDIWTMGK